MFESSIHQIYGTTEGIYTLSTSPTYSEAGSYTVYYQVTAENYVTQTGTAYVVIMAQDGLTVSFKNGIKVEVEGNTTYVKNIKPCNIKQFKDNIVTNGTIEIYVDNTIITDETSDLKTSMRLKISKNNEVKEYIIVVTGDLTGDGKVNGSDILKLARYKAGFNDAQLTGCYLKAADINQDEQYAGDVDLLKMARVLVGLDNL